MFESIPHDRRRFLRLAATFSAGACLAGCGGGGSPASDRVTVIPSPAIAEAMPTPQATANAHPLGMALNLAYLGAQYYGIAATGNGLPADLTTGTGAAGTATGARQIAFTDPLVASVAAEIAADKRMQIVALRRRIGPEVAAQPSLDLSTSPHGAFSVAAQGAGIVAAGVAFDPYGGDDDFLLGAFLIENAVAAVHRTALAQGDDATLAMMTAQLGDAVYHGGLIRTLLDARASTDGSIGRAMTGATALFATLDGSDVGDQSLANARGASANIADADGRPIPFTRANAQVLKALYLSGTGVGGFLPNGVNGVIA